MIFEPYMHYNLDFLEPGKFWYPFEDKLRMENYEFSREQFDLIPADLLYQTFPRGLLVFANGFSDFTHCTRLLAYPRLLTIKTVDMVVGQPPTINAQSKENLLDKIRDSRNASCLNEELKKALIDYSRYGVALLRVFKDERGKARVTAWDPSEWVPVFYADGTRRIKYNVIGWIHDEILTVQIHHTEDGSYEERDYECVGRVIGKLLKSKTYNKTSGKCLFFSILNTPSTSNPFGTNDYLIVNSLLQKAIERLTAILRVLDEHADPSMTGPYGLLDKTESGEVVFKTSKYYAIGDKDQKPEYLVWNANLDSSFKAFEELCKQIYILSEMGEAFIGAPGGAGNVVSGTAMRFKMISPLEKARRIQETFTEPLKEIISSILMLNGTDIESKEININWKDSLPRDPREMAELTRLESGSPAIKPLGNALIDNYNLDKETADYYVEKVLDFQDLIKNIGGANVDLATGTDGRSRKAANYVDTRKKGSMMDPASSENRGDDENANLN